MTVASPFTPIHALKSRYNWGLYVKRALIVAVVLALGPYARTAFYEFPEPTPFSGPAFYNPYGNLSGPWQRANLHAHGRPWWGFTTGKQTSTEVAEAYRRAGYSVPGVSDYQHIAASAGTRTIPLYEHGYNLGKRHQLAVGARRVLWFDFPFGQSLHQQQLIIDLLRERSDLVAIAHPEGREAYSLDEMRRLTGYQLIELVNGPFVADTEWDAALSAGRPVWLLANDDNHDLNDLPRFGTAWNMIAAPSSETADVVHALRHGRSYGVVRLEEITPEGRTDLSSVTFEDGTLTVTCVGNPSTIVFVGQNGHQRARIPDTLSASYTFTKDDPYIRAVVYTPHTTIFLNPIFRYDGVRMPAPAARMDVFTTWTLRAAGVLGTGLFVFLVTRRRTAPAPARERRVVGEADENPA